MNKIKQKPVAVFDIDGTLFRSSLMLELLETLIEDNYLPQKTRTLYEEDYKKWIDRQGSYYDFMMKAVEAYENNIQGLKVQDILNIADMLLENNKYKVYRFTRSLIRELKETHFLLAISYSPFRVAEPFARFWGFDKTYSKLYEADAKGRFTGKIKTEDFIMYKNKVLKRAIEKENLTLKGSVGVGDTESDAEFLKLVDRPIAFNPNKTLYKKAKRNKWRVVVERKDVIYDIK